MNPRLLLGLALGLFWTYCLIIPYGLFVAWFGIGFWDNRWPAWWELISATLVIPLGVMVTTWYFTLPLAAGIGWCLYLRKQTRTSHKNNHTS